MPAAITSIELKPSGYYSQKLTVWRTKAAVQLTSSATGSLSVEPGPKK
jgi:hypothetical protein